MMPGTISARPIPYPMARPHREDQGNKKAREAICFAGFS